MSSPLVTPGGALPREFEGSFRVGKRSRKAITLYSPGATGRFAGKRYQFRFDGVGFKRGGKYLTTSGTIEAAESLTSEDGSELSACCVSSLEQCAEQDFECLHCSRCHKQQ